MPVGTLREAAQPLIDAHHQGSVDLIVDGGSENNNSTVEGFISVSQISIHKLVALRDVHFSNSIVEAVNKVVKYRYLFPKKLPDGASLDKAVGEAILDYNELRLSRQFGDRTVHSMDSHLARHTTASTRRACAPARSSKRPRKHGLSKTPKDLAKIGAKSAKTRSN